MMQHRNLTRLIPGLVAVLLAACKAGPDYHPPTPPGGEHFTHEPTGTQPAGAVELKWWGRFNDPLLTRLVEQTLAGNTEVHIATARLAEARSLLTQAGLELLPGVSARGVYNAQKRSLDALNRRNFVPRNLELFNAGFDATWELDLFGRLRRRVEASAADMEASRAVRRDVIVSVIAETVRNYLALRGIQAERDLTQAIVANQRELLTLTEALLQAGQGTELDTARSRELLSVTEATLPELDTAAEQAIHRLSVLSGQVPDALRPMLAEPRPLPVLPGGLEPVQPQALLRRRPDIRVAEQNLRAATAAIGVVTAELFPRLTFSGNFSLESRTLLGLGGPGSESFLAGPRLTWAAFDLGRIRARIAAARSGAEATLADYEQTVLLALEDTENALFNFSQQRTRLIALEAARDASRTARHLSQLRFEAGVSDLMPVVDAERRVLEDERQQIRGQTAALTALVSVYKALGGGWEPFDGEG